MLDRYKHSTTIDVHILEAEIPAIFYERDLNIGLFVKVQSDDDLPKHLHLGKVDMIRRVIDIKEKAVKEQRNRT